MHNKYLDGKLYKSSPYKPENDFSSFSYDPTCPLDPPSTHDP